MPIITSKIIQEIESEFAKWAEFINVGVGSLSFSLAISCLGNARPDITGGISLFFTLFFMIYGQKHFPKKVRELRKAELGEIDQLRLIKLEKNYFSFGSLIRYYPVFLIGWIFLGCVALYGYYR